MTIRFNSVSPKLIAKRKSVHELCRQFSKSPSKGNLKRVKGLFQHCGAGVIIESGLHMDYGNNIQIGERVYININCTFIDSPNGIEALPCEVSTTIVIGDDCLIGPNVQFLSVSHDVDPKLRQENKHNYAEKIILENNVWLGAGVIILAGVIIGEGSVVGAGSVVTKNVEPNSLYAGNPAVKIRDL